MWRSVQDELPSWSTSGGQFSGGKRAAVATAGGVVVEIWEGLRDRCFVIAAHEAKEVQLRHLCDFLVRDFEKGSGDYELTASHLDLVLRLSAASLAWCRQHRLAAFRRVMAGLAYL